MLRMVTAQITAIAEDTTVTAEIDGALKFGIPTVFVPDRPPVLQELWVFLVGGNVTLGLGPTYNTSFA